jgi:hypothetical protein
LLGKTGIDISRKGSRSRSNQQAGASFLWLFAFFWNAISVPIAILVVPPAIQEGEWAALFVLLFPVIGMLLLWGAIAATIKAVRMRFARREKAAPTTFEAQRRSDGFARGMIDDPRPAPAGGAIDTTDDGLPSR